MKKLNFFHVLSLVALVVFITMPVGLKAQTTPAGHGTHFVDLNGDGYNDNAPDADGDGIPNGQDPDYVRVGAGHGRTFVDADGDGFNDNAPDADGDGIPNGQDPDYQRLQNGSGNRHGQMSGTRNEVRMANRRNLEKRPGATGQTGANCDGTGPKGQHRGRP